MNPAISVIIPTQNRRHLLPKTLESVFKQSLQPSEIIVVDDHSSDDSVSFLKEQYRGQVIIVEAKGSGPGAARNTGMSIATGQFIKFFDSDDLMTSNSLEEQFKTLNNSTKAFVYGPYFYAREVDDAWETNNIVLNYHPFGDHPLWHFMMVDGFFITIPGMLFRKELLGEVGQWREDAIASEDWEYLFRISLIEPYPVHTNSCAFLYRLHQAQTTASNLSDLKRDSDKVNVLKSLYARVIANDSRFSRWEKLAFQNKFYQVWRTAEFNTPLKNLVSNSNSSRQKAIWQLQRVRNKIGRWRTGTQWQPCHGPLKSKEKIQQYMSLIS